MMTATKTRSSSFAQTFSLLTTVTEAPQIVGQTAHGSSDHHCHVIAGGKTLCGQRVGKVKVHKVGRCPNRHPVCQTCQGLL
jgi:hypothetical protein